MVKKQKLLRIAKRNPHWVNSIVIDALNSKVEIELTTNPESQNIDAKLRFIDSSFAQSRIGKDT